MRLRPLFVLLAAPILLTACESLPPLWKPLGQTPPQETAPQPVRKGQRREKDAPAPKADKAAEVAEPATESQPAATGAVTEPVPSPETAKQPSQQQEDAKPVPAAPAAYADYRAGLIGNGQSSVLFFHASWCPICKRAEASLQDLYGSTPPALTTYKVDYDSNVELRQRYGVTYQHTFVLIDGEGNAIKTLQSPTDAQLKALLG